MVLYLFTLMTFKSWTNFARKDELDLNISESEEED